MSLWRRPVLYIALWLILIAGACLIDARLAFHVYSSGIYEMVKYSMLFRVMKAPGTFYATLVLVLLVWWASPRSIETAILLCVSAIMAGLLYTLGKWCIGRSRPIGNGVFNPHPFQMHFFHDGLAGLFISPPDQSFPSGHVCLAFATATALGMCIPRWGPAFFAAAALVGAERLLEGAHYLSDVVAGAGLGILAAIAARRICERLSLLNRST